MNEAMGDETDERLVFRAKQGDVEAFTELVRSCQERVFRTILSFTRNVQDADDLMQETFLQAYRNLGEFKGRSSFFTWVYRIAVNRSLNFLKKKRQEKGRETLDDNTPASDEGPAAASPETDSLREELRRKMKEAIDGLPLLYRAAFVLVVDQGLSHDQAARVLKCAANTVAWRMHRARKLLQKKLGPYIERSAS
jgi:RNA polymerase sigma-70 factor (ECF subfamily)